MREGEYRKRRKEREEEEEEEESGASHLESYSDFG